MDLYDPLVRQIVTGLDNSRNSPPRLLRALMRSWPRLFLVGAAGVLILFAMEIPLPFVGFFAGMFFGAALRDVGFARKQKRFWPIQKELFDWQKIDDLSRQLAP